MFEFKVISGGQSGADLGGIIFAQIHRIDHEVNTYRGFKPIRGKIPENVKVNYITDKIGIPGLRIRTEYNVKNSDITLIFVMKDLVKTKGSRLTAKYCQFYNMPYIVIKVQRNINYKMGIEDDFDKFDDEYICEYIDKNKQKNYIELDDISGYLNALSLDEDKIDRKLIINVAGERHWKEDKIVKILEKIFYKDS